MLSVMQLQAESNQQQLLTLLTLSLESKPSEGEKEITGSSGDKDLNGKEKGDSTGPTFTSGWARLNRNLLDEFRQSVKKVELLMFNGADLGEMIVDLGKQTMKFQNNNKWVMA